VAQRDKDFVTYKYGLQQSLGADPEQNSLDYIEALREQEGSRVGQDYLRALARHLQEFPYGPTQAMVDYRIAAYHAREGNDVEAALHAARALTINPDRDLRHRAEELLAAVLRDNRERWAYSWERSLAAVSKLAEAAEEDYWSSAPARSSAERHLDLVRMLERAPVRAFRRAALAEVGRLLRTDPENVDMVAVLDLAGRLQESLDRNDEAITVYTVIREFYPEREPAERAAQRVRVLEAMEEEAAADSDADADSEAAAGSEVAD
jgi:tetratricopeptide (TPR) repeat protein